MSQNSANQKFKNNADGFDIAGGDTERKLTVTGGDVEIEGSGSAVITFPATTSTLATTDDVPVKASGAEIDTGTNDNKFTTPKAIADSAVTTATKTQTLTNKRITPRVSSETSSATPTINTDNVDIHRITALAVDITSMTTNLSGTPTHGQTLIIEITGTAARAIAWGSSFEASTVALPTTTVTTATLSVGFKWNSGTSKWRCLASA
jgi:hypothetical protein